MESEKKKRFHLLVVIGLLLSVFVIYGQVISHDFVNYDDQQYVYENPYVLDGLSLDNIIWAFGTGYKGNWHPLTWISHMLDVQLFGLNPGWHHLVNVLFHLLNTLFLFLLFQKMTGAFWRSLFVSALFALHPLHVESVAWIAERKDVLSAFFWMLTMWFYLRYVEKPVLSQYLYVVLFFILGLLSKPMLVTLPFVLLLLDYWPLKRFGLETPKSSHSKKWPIPLPLIREKIPLFVLALLSAFITFFVEKAGGSVVLLEQVSFKLRIFNVIASYMGYLWKTFWPFKLAVLYPFSFRMGTLNIIISALILSVITIYVIYQWKRRAYLAVGWFWYLGTLVPVIGLVQIGEQAMADRYTYIPLIGIFIMLAWGIPQVLEKMRCPKTVFPVVMAVVLLFLAPLTWVQISYWKDTERLFVHTIKNTRNNYSVYDKLGFFYSKQGKLEKAVEQFNKALQINPGFEKAHNSLGAVYEKLGNFTQAAAEYAKAIQLNPGYAAAYNNLGKLLLEGGKTDEAISQFRKALEINPHNDMAQTNIGNALARKGMLDQAITHYNEAIRINPRSVLAQNNLGTALLRKGKLEEAIPHFKEVLRIDPSEEYANETLGILFGQLGRFEESVFYFQQALKTDFDNAKVHNNLAVALAQLRKFDEALFHLREALRIDPEYKDAKENLRMLLDILQKSR